MAPELHSNRFRMTMMAEGEPRLSALRALSQSVKQRPVVEGVAHHEHMGGGLHRIRELAPEGVHSHLDLAERVLIGIGVEHSWRQAVVVVLVARFDTNALAGLAIPSDCPVEMQMGHL